MRQVQIGLAAAGLYAGTIDGVFGPLTCAGLMAYAAERGVDKDLLDRARHLAPEMVAAKILTPLRIGHFLATLCVESQGFTRDQEDLNYRTPERLDGLFSAVHGVEDAAQLIKAGPVAIANRVYAGRNGNGNEASGDGYRFRGRSAAQLTGRDNYRQMAAKLCLPLEVQPDLVLQADVSARVAVRFWVDKGLNAFADINDAASIRHRWNGPAMVGLADTRRTASKVAELLSLSRS